MDDRSWPAAADFPDPSGRPSLTDLLGHSTMLGRAAESVILRRSAPPDHLHDARGNSTF